MDGRILQNNYTRTCNVGCGGDESWDHFRFNIHGFEELSSDSDDLVYLPEFSWKGHVWSLHIFPGGSNDARDGYVSIFLDHTSEKNMGSISYEIKILDKFGQTKRRWSAKTDRIEGIRFFGWSDFIKRSDILDESTNILDSNGTLTVIVSLKDESSMEPKEFFRPKNPFLKMMQGMLRDGTAADLCFEVSASEIREDAKRARSVVTFHAHSLILQVCAPTLAALCGSSNDAIADKVCISDVRPQVFHHILRYAYGGSVVEEDMKEHAKEIIEAADKYSIVNLKLEAEAAYVKETRITMENAMDNLLFADAKNCALLKEAVMDYLAENCIEAAEKISFNDFPSHVVKDFMVAVGRSMKEVSANGSGCDKFCVMRVGELRRMLDEKGLDVDGSREAMIEALKKNEEEAKEDEDDESTDSSG